MGVASPVVLQRTLAGVYLPAEDKLYLLTCNSPPV